MCCLSITASVDFNRLIREHALLDVVSVDGLHYAIANREPVPAIPGCTVITTAQLPSYLQYFLRAGFSQRYHQQYSLLVGLRAWVLYTYDLKGLPAIRKQMLSHVLSGSGGRRGKLAKWSGQKIGRNCFLVPLEAEAEAAAFLSEREVPYKSEVVLRAE